MNMVEHLIHLPLLVPAKERVHENHYHFDEKYELKPLNGLIEFSADIAYDRTTLIIEANNRLT